MVHYKTLDERKVKIDISLSKSTKDKLTYLANKQNITISALIRNILDNILSDVSCDGVIGRQKKQKTYIMCDLSTNLIKIGCSENPEYREKTLQSEKPTIELMYICEDNVEKELHEKYSDKRKRGEWFDLNIYDIMNIVNAYNFQEVKQEKQ